LYTEKILQVGYDNHIRAMFPDRDAQTALAVQAAQAAATSAKSSAAAASATVVNLNQIAANALYWKGAYSANIYYALAAVVTYSGVVYVHATRRRRASDG
jgi:malate/lactate dehydrogenase